MAKKKRLHSATVRQATKLLGDRIREGRIDRRWTVRDLAERAGISTNTLARVERGDPSVSIGVAFDTATLVGVPLFYAEAGRLATEVARSGERAALLPRRVRRANDDVRDDF